MSFSEAWKKIRDQAPMDTMDNMDTNISPEINSVHCVQSVHKGEYYKTDILDAEKREDWFDQHIQHVIDELGCSGVSIMDYPPATRHRALELDEMLTRAANEGDRKTFLVYLKQWRECFH